MRTKVHRSPSAEAWQAKARPVRLIRSQAVSPSTSQALASSEWPRVTTVQMVGRRGDSSRQSFAHSRSPACTVSTPASKGAAKPTVTRAASWKSPVGAASSRGASDAGSSASPAGGTKRSWRAPARPVSTPSS